ncbi:hypothetical protein FDECE_6859 [Fusarium decemcellulare]|nr:hypothetical protein FDECE_6859 [Fusarium decemcellulare]
MSRSERVPAAQWDTHRELIRSLYIDQDKTLDEVMEHMSQRYDFRASKSQYIHRVTVAWKMKKNFTRTQWEHANAILSKREAEGKLSQLTMDGKIVSSKKLKKERKRYSAAHNGQLDTSQDVSSDVAAWTPQWPELRPVMRNTMPGLRAFDHIGFFGPRPDGVGIETEWVPSCLLKEMLRQALGASQKSWPADVSFAQLMDITANAMPNDNSELETHSPAPSEKWSGFIRYAVFMAVNGFLSGDALDEFLGLAITTGAITTLKQVMLLNNPTIEVLASKLLISAIRVCKDPELDLVRLLLQQGVCPNSLGSSIGNRESQRQTALQTAILSGSQPCVKLLLDSGADPNLSTEEFAQSPLNLALAGRNLHSMVKMLINQGADVSQIDMKGGYQRLPIMEAVRHRDIALVEQLLQAGADPNTFVRSGLFALHVAIHNQDLEIARALLDGGADPDFLCENKQFNAVKSARERPLGSGEEFWATRLSAPIRTAVEKSNTAILQALLVAGANIDGYIDPDPLNGLAGVVWKLNELEDASRTALQTAIIKRDVPMVELLLNRGAGANAGHHTVPSPLQLACQLKEPAPQKTDLVTLLLKCGADVNAPAAHQEGATALQAAIETGRMDLATLLLHSGATINTELWNEDGLAWLPAAESENSGMMPHLQCLQKKMAVDLRAAVQSGSTLGVRQLLDAGADINGVEDGHSLLCESIWREDRTMFDFLLLNGIAPDPDGADQTPLCAATSRRNRYMMQSLLKAGADVNRQSIHKPPERPLSSLDYVFWPTGCYTPIIAAVRAERADLVQMLVGEGANVNPPNSHSSPSPLLLAISYETWQIAHLLLHHGADPNATDLEDGAAAIHKVLRTDSVYRADMCEVLIEFEANVNAASSIGSPIQLACVLYDPYEDTDTLIQALVDAGADVNAPATEGFPMTALQKASEVNNNNAVISLLLDLGADIHAPAFWKGGMTALQIAVKSENVELIKKFISLDVDVNAPPAREMGATALQFAAMKGNIKIAMLLLEKGACINAPGSEVGGRTALQGAAENGRLDMVYLLLENDDEGDLIEERCQAAAKYAQDEGHFVLAKLLREWKKL